MLNFKMLLLQKFSSIFRQILWKVIDKTMIKEEDKLLLLSDLNFKNKIWHF